MLPDYPRSTRQPADRPPPSPPRVREADGCWPTDTTPELDRATRDLVEAFRVAGNGTCVLGRVNLCERLTVPMVEHTEPTELYTPVGWSFVLLRWDERLRQMILDRHKTPYIGTRDDRVRVNAIFDRVEELGGELI